ncbi:hypothetical protein UYO_1553 [Lachnospiraceae bacterium JC7]|nr:hypothetical protein UYO_1553 [Lachnospiraceae bacterium JC7]
MTTEEKLLEAIEKRGHEAKLNDVVKNGVVRKAIAVKGKGNCSLNIYIEQFVKDTENGADPDTVADEILAIAAKHDGIYFDIENTFNREYIMSHVSIAVQRESTENLIKKSCEFEGLECYLYLRVKVQREEGCIKLNSMILERTGLTEEEIWEQAEKNLRAETVIKPIFDVVCEIMKESGRNPEFSDKQKQEMMAESDKEIYVITNKLKFYGASAILDKVNIKAFAEKCGVKNFIVIPSSRHEMILVPEMATVDFAVISNMVKEINETMVSAEDRLTDRAYRMTA